MDSDDRGNFAPWGHGICFSLAVSLTTASYADVARPDPVSDFIRHTMQVSSFERATADLNGDGRPEEFVYVTDTRRCGSGGCTLLILTPVGSTFSIVTHATVTWPPVRLLQSRTNGWHDIAVTVGGGGISPAHEVALRIDGHSYPSNPTLLPALQTKEASGTILIAAFAEQDMPTSAELAAAIQAFSGKHAPAADVRNVSCERFDEEPTEAACSWQQKAGDSWQGYSSYLAVDGRGWHLIDEPARVP